MFYRPRSFLEMGNLANDFKHRPQGKLHLQYRPPAVAPVGRSGAPIPGSFLSWPNGSVWAANLLEWRRGGCLRV